MKDKTGMTLEKKHDNVICKNCFYGPGCIEDGYSIQDKSCPISISESALIEKEFRMKI